MYINISNINLIIISLEFIKIKSLKKPHNAKWNNYCPSISYNYLVFLDKLSAFRKNRPSANHLNSFESVFYRIKNFIFI